MTKRRFEQICSWLGRNCLGIDRFYLWEYYRKYPSCKRPHLVRGFSISVEELFELLNAWEDLADLKPDMCTSPSTRGEQDRAIAWDCEGG